jgi:hypothetical protein
LPARQCQALAGGEIRNFFIYRFKNWETRACPTRITQSELEGSFFNFASSPNLDSFVFPQTDSISNHV